MFYLASEMPKIWRCFLTERKVTLSWLMNSNMVKPEQSFPLGSSLYSTFKAESYKSTWNSKVQKSVPKIAFYKNRTNTSRCFPTPLCFMSGPPKQYFRR